MKHFSLKDSLIQSENNHYAPNHLQNQIKAKIELIQFARAIGELFTLLPITLFLRQLEPNHKKGGE